MKKLAIVCIIVASTTMFAGCGNKENENNNEENSVQKVEQNANGNEEKSQDEQKDESKEEGNEEAKQNEKVLLKVYFYDAASDKMTSEDMKVDKIDENVILNQLIAKGVIEEGSKINKVNKSDGVMTIDFNKNIIGQNVGSGVESSRLQAVANTFIDGMKVNKIRITINGKNYESGHISLGDKDYFTKKQGSQNEKVILKVYSYDAAADKMNSEDIKVDKIDENIILNQLISKGVIEKGSQINKVNKKDGAITIDFNKNIIGQNVGSGVESSRLQAVANTFIDGLKVSKVRITINGENYKSGHMDLGDNDYFTK